MFYNYNYVYAAPLQARANPIDKTTFNTTATNLTHSLFLIGQKIWLQEQFPAHGVCITMLIYADAHANVPVCSYPRLLHSLFQDSIQTVLVWGEQYMVGVWWFLTWSFKDKKKKKSLCEESREPMVYWVCWRKTKEETLVNNKIWNIADGTSSLCILSFSKPKRDISSSWPKMYLEGNCEVYGQC